MAPLGPLRECLHPVVLYTSNLSPTLSPSRCESPVQLCVFVPVPSTCMVVEGTHMVDESSTVPSGQFKGLSAGGRRIFHRGPRPFKGFPSTSFRCEPRWKMSRPKLGQVGRPEGQVKNQVGRSSGQVKGQVVTSPTLCFLYAFLKQLTFLAFFISLGSSPQPLCWRRSGASPPIWSSLVSDSGGSQHSWLLVPFLRLTGTTCCSPLCQSPSQF
jgi:hypothetical protein